MAEVRACSLHKEEVKVEDNVMVVDSPTEQAYQALSRLRQADAAGRVEVRADRVAGAGTRRRGAGSRWR